MLRGLGLSIDQRLQLQSWSWLFKLPFAPENLIPLLTSTGLLLFIVRLRLHPQLRITQTPPPPLPPPSDGSSAPPATSASAPLIALKCVEVDSDDALANSRNGALHSPVASASKEPVTSTASAEISAASAFEASASATPGAVASAADAAAAAEASPTAAADSAASAAAPRSSASASSSAAAALRYAEKDRKSTCAFADRVAQCALEAYRRHAAAAGVEYKQTVVAAVVAVLRREHGPARFTAISLGVGTKFLRAELIAADGAGACVRDCHAEVLARRGFHRYGMLQLLGCLRANPDPNPNPNSNPTPTLNPTLSQVHDAAAA